MTQIKIVSNPYNRSLAYYIYKESAGAWENIKSDSINSRLRENDEEKIFLPFTIREIIDTILKEYYVPGGEGIELIFEGTADEYEEVWNVCREEDLSGKVHLTRSPKILENARDILDHTKEIFERVEPVLQSIVKDDPGIMNKLKKVSAALENRIPVCIFGNYSAGKSTFINALIGHEILPSGGDPVTSKIYKIERSQQEDRARIKFSYKREEFELYFDTETCRVVKGDTETDLMQEIFAEIGALERPDLFRMVSRTISIVNTFEKSDQTVTVFSNVIELEVPFSDKGKLGQSRNAFVLFDTPGSNSNSNVEHETVLADALEGFSNGIPIWVSTYDGLDTKDNSALCDKILSIQALDKRFTMIVVNRADQADLEGEALSDAQIAEILEYDSVEAMYASGIFFVSSIMGLGAKLDGNLEDKFYRKTFRQQKDAYSDPEDEYYTTLYKFNIMPEQIKKRVLKKSGQYADRIYANSGLYCIEEEMEEFASKYSAYNKCQMAYKFLKSSIDETGRKIAEKTAVRERNMKMLEQDLDAKESELITNLHTVMDNSVKQHERDSNLYMARFVSESLHYGLTSEELERREKSITAEYAQDANLAAYARDLEAAKSSKDKNFKENLGNLFKGNIRDSTRNLGNLAAEWANDRREVQQRKESHAAIKRDIDKSTSDEMMEFVIAEFRNSIIDAQERIGNTARGYWKAAEQGLREELISLIAGSEALSEQQRTELSDIILQYRPLVFDDEADKVFIKAKFLRGNVLGIHLGTSEKLDNGKLSKRYNAKLRKDLDEITEMMNTSCFHNFQIWQEKLLAVVEKNIEQYNPELRKISEMISDERELIAELQNNQRMISTSLETIETMMDWKEPA